MRVAQAIDQRKGKVYLITPSSGASEVMADRLSRLVPAELASPANHEITTFPKFCALICSQTWLSVIERDRLLRAVVDDLSEHGRLGYFGETARFPGFISSTAAFIDELWKSGTDAALFSAIAARGDEKSKDIAMIFSEYTDRLKQLGLTDSEGLCALALAGLETQSEQRIDLPPISLVAADGFDFYTAAQVRLLRHLACMGIETLATLAYEENRPVHLWQERTYRRFNEAGAEIIECCLEPISPLDLAALRFMEDDAEGETESCILQQTQNPVTVFSAPDREREVRAVAREIKRLILNEGLAPKEITVVCRTLSLYESTLERVFKEYAIGLKVDCALPLGENPMIVALDGLLKLASVNFPRRAVLDALRSPYFDFSGLGLDPDSVDLLDCVSIDENVTRGREQWSKAVAVASKDPKARTREWDEQDASTESSEARRSRYSWIEEKLGALFDLITPRRTGSPNDYAGFIRSLLDKLSVEKALKHGPFSDRDQKAFEAFHQALDAVARGGRAVAARTQEFTSWSGFSADLDRAVQAVSYERLCGDADTVLAQEVHDLRPRRYSALFVLGLIEGEFPARSPETAPYTRAELAGLREEGIDLTESIADPGADLAQFHKAMTRTSDRLYLSYARTDIAGGELLRSYLIDEIRLVAPVTEIRIGGAGQTVRDLSQPEFASLQELALSTARGLRGGATTSGSSNDARLLDSTLASWKATVRAVEVESARLSRRSVDSFAGVINDDFLAGEIKTHLGSKHLWSASQINDYGICPFRFFARNVLRLYSADEPVTGFVADRLGTAYHRILEEVYKDFQSRQIAVTVDSFTEIRAEVERISEGVLEAMLEKGEIRKGLLWDYEKADIQRRVAELVFKEIEWADGQSVGRSDFEVSFGRHGEPPLVIDCEDEEVRICGVIDRIDEGAEGCVVIDYKTGRTPIKHSDAIEGRNLQLPIYLMAASRVVKPGTSVRAGYYLHINSRKKGSEFAGKDEPAHSVEDIIAQAEEHIRKYVVSARRGQFPVRPNGGKCPPYCEFDGLCRVHAQGSAEKE